MKSRINGFRKIALIVLLVALVVASVAFSTGAASGTNATAQEGRTFKDITSLDNRLELTKPLEDIPLTWEAEIKIEGTADALCKGTLFGQYNGKTNTFFNFEIFTYQGQPCPTLCYVNNYTPTSYNSVVFGKDSAPIKDADGKTNTLSDHVGEWVTVAITATLVDASNNCYDVDCYINGEKAYETIKSRKNMIFSESNLEATQNINRFALGSNAVSTDPVEFPGTIRKLALYGNSLTADQIASSYKNGVSKEGTDLIAYYDMSVVEDLWYEEDLSGNGYHLARADKVYNVNSEGRGGFSKDDRLLLTKKLTEAPLTVEAVIKTTSQGCTVFGNTTTGSVGCLNFEIYKSQPALCFPTNASGTRGSVIFSTPLEGVSGFTPNASDKDGFTYIAITATPTGVENTYNFDCYVNGVKAYATITNKVAYLDAELIQAAGNLAIGANGGSSQFAGNIRSINLYNRPLTAAEIRASYIFETTFDGMIAGYDMSDYSHVRNPQFEADISGNGYHAQKANNETVGKWFDSTAGGDKVAASADTAKPYFVYNTIEQMPRTYEMTVYVNGNDSNEVFSSTVFGNYPNAGKACINLEFFNKGIALCLWDYDASGKLVKDTIQFTYKPKANQWLHLVVANEVVEGKSIYKLYINGEHVDTVTSKPNVHDIIDSQTATRLFSLGGSGAKSFNGGLIDFALYSDSLTAEEVMDSFKNGVNKYDESLIAYYDLKTVAGDEFIQDLSGNNHHASKNDYTAVEGGRWFNLDEERLAVSKNYEDAPLTISAEIYIPESVNKANTIFGNYYARDFINFEITSNNKAALVINELPENLISTNSAAYIHSIIFNEDIPRGDWTTLTVVYDKYCTTDDRYALYINGVKSTAGYTFGGIHNDKNSNDTKIVSHTFELDMEWIQRAIPFMLGRDATKCFQGKIKNLALYSEPLSAEEIASICADGVDMTSRDLFAYYNLDNPENTKTYVKDETGNGYDFTYRFFESESEETYDYSFAFLGDTQFLVYKDILEGTTKYTKPIYDWLIANKDEKNLQYVFGLGDISDKDMIAEYEYAAYLYSTLGDAGIKYAAIPGNHDGQTAYLKYDSVFSQDAYLTNGIGYYKEGSVANYYKTFEVGEYKYMVVVLEFGAPDAVLDWANNAVAANPDRQVIVLTHGYIGYDGGFLSEKELHAPNANNGLNSGEEIWTKFVSQHSNIIISACGHIDPYNIKQRTDVGVNGNSVQQFLIDPQALDKTSSYDTGMVAMFYFSNGGKDVRVEYVSATKSLRAQASDPNAKDIVYGEANQFTFTLDIPTAEKVVTAYGELPYINTNLDLNAVVLFKNGTDGAYTFVGGYASLDLALAEVIKDSTGSYTVLLRDNTRMSSKVSFNNFSGNLTLDLGGYELKVDQSGNYLFDIYRNNATVIDATYTVKNGSITKAHGRGLNCINYGTGIAADSNISFTYDNVTFKSLTSSLVNNVIFCNWENGYSDAITNKMYVNAVFNNCTFDLKNSINGALMFSMTNTENGGDVVVYDVTVNGGVIAVKDATDLEGLYTQDALDKITFGKTVGGNYTALVAPYGSSEPTALYNGLEFVKISETQDEVVYRLRPTEVSDVVYAPKMSITLATEFVMNVYVPVNYTESFTFNGVEYNSENSYGGKVTTLEDGYDYYVISVALGSSEAASELKLVSTVNANGTVATATFTFSIPKYAAKVIALGSEVEKTLARDVLAYVKAAYNYFVDHNTSAEIARVNTLIDSILGDYTAAPTISGTVAKDTAGIVTDVTLNLSANPTIRFYVTTTDVQFKLGDKVLKTVVSPDGTYVELDVYAYVLAETITFGDGGSYHISDFVNGAKGTDHEALVNAFVKYVESAANYRSFVINK